MNRFENRLKFFEEVEEIKPQIYYHYTSLDALYKIVSSKALWLTSLKSSNDKKELFYTVDDFMKDFAIVCDTEEPGNIKACFNMLKDNIDENIQAFTQTCSAKSKPYALCLSDKRDNLTHWDRYAASSTGVCIGINVAALKVLFSRTGSEGFGSSIFDIGKALYTTEDIRRYIRNETIRNLNILLDIIKEDSREKLLEKISKSGYIFTMGVCQNVIRFAKNPSFIDEGEVRFYFDKNSIPETLALLNSMKDLGNNELCDTLIVNFKNLLTLLKIENEEFFLSKSGIRGYHSLFLEEIWGPGLITEIILGPMCVQNRNELLRFLSENGLSGTKVCVSKVPLR